jgi:hypothetical protein
VVLEAEHVLDAPVSGVLVAWNGEPDGDHAVLLGSCSQSPAAAAGRRARQRRLRSGGAGRWCRRCRAAATTWWTTRAWPHRCARWHARRWTRRHPRTRPGAGHAHRLGQRGAPGVGPRPPPTPEP